MPKKLVVHFRNIFVIPNGSVMGKTVSSNYYIIKFTVQHDRVERTVMFLNCFGDGTFGGEESSNMFDEPLFMSAI